MAVGALIGFVLATVNRLRFCGGSADMIGVVMNAQRGSSGFIFLALPFFILAGFITDRADIGARIVDFVAALMGHVRGGLLQVMIVGVYISSSISGSKAADMATIGIPMSRRLAAHGYAPHECAALLAAAAAMAESVPPSIALILVGSATSISTGALFVAGLLPAATLAICLMILVRVRASIYGWAPSTRAPRVAVLRAGGTAILPLLMPVILIGGIVSGVGTPTEVSTFAVVYGLVLGLIYRQLSPGTFWQSDRRLDTQRHQLCHLGGDVFSWALTLEVSPWRSAQFVGASAQSHPAGADRHHGADGRAVASSPS